ncbi:hypothetical protein SAMN05444278_1159 [Psychroflexus salarius]|uniref:Uncharacterized protein n=1 Tax=Psychroflexus salarius TaxID=1155689 RepID=A0A1M4Y6W0_9FLAO|nr:hypothetical protein SAMN05444278_1159 [Psychroflexus salarius]
MKNILISKITTNFLWTFFGIITSLNYYSKEEYFISGFMCLFTILYGFKTLQSVIENKKNEKDSL